MFSRKNAINTSAAVVLAGILAAPVWALTPATFTDTNGDGVISADEIQQSRATKKAAAMSEFDTDGDGEFSRAERKEMKKARRAAMIAEYDIDGDGKLSRTEKRAAKEARRSAIEAQLDVNGDGEVSAEERVGFDEIKEQRRGHGKKGKNGRKRGYSHDSDDDTSA